MEDKLVSKYIPLDKSWIIRMGILDMVNGYDDIQKFLSNQKNLGDDILALKRAADVWTSGQFIDVGESGTLYRFLRFAVWKLGLNKKFIVSGTLKSRKITEDQNIINLSQAELLKLDNGTSQWASAKVLLGDKERLDNPPYKLKLTYEAVEHWQEERNKNQLWIPRYDKTILEQAKSYLAMVNKKNYDFYPKQAEDFCFAYVFGMMSSRDGEKKWPSLHGHESDRIKEIEEMINKAKKGDSVNSKDHRVIQAIAMWGKIKNKKIKFTYPEVVNKSWPQFWDFIRDN